MSLLLLTQITYNQKGFRVSLKIMGMKRLSENSLYQLEGYNSLHQNRKHENGGGVAIFVKDSYSFKKSSHSHILSITCEAIESLSIEINNESKNVVYRPPDGDIDVCEN